MSLETVAALIGIFTFIGGLIAWYKGAVQKEYASQRDWEHVKNNQKQLVENLNFIFKEIEEKLEQGFDKVQNYNDTRFDRIDAQQMELKSLLYGLFGVRNKRDDERSPQ